MSETLTIRLRHIHPVTIYGGVALARAWRRVTGGSLRLQTKSTGASVAFSLGSLVRPSVVVDFDRVYPTPAATTAHALALTTAAWDALTPPEVWRELSAPLHRLPRLGEPNYSAPWALSLSSVDEAATPLSSDVQHHVIGGLRPPSAESVWWPRSSNVVAAVLGRAHVVVGREDPLVFDAIRAGVPIHHGPSPALTVSSLAGLVPPSIVGADRLWNHVAEMARDVHRGATPEPLMTSTWVAYGRDRVGKYRVTPPSDLQVMHRRYRKLRRDPQSFFQDSRHRLLRTLGDFMFSDRV